MRTRHSLLLLALTAFAGTAFAGAPQAANPEPAKTSTASKAEHKDKRTCEQRSKAGHCEKWAKSETKTAAAKKP
jgi:hypothetical protein